MTSPRSSVLPWRLYASIITALVLVVGTWCDSAEAAFEYERGSVTSYALGGVVATDEALALDLLQNPAVFIDGHVAVEGWVSRLYNLDDFDLGAGAALINYRLFTAGVAAVQLTGSDFYWEKEVSGLLAVSPWTHFRIGLRADRRTVEYALGYGRFGLTSFSAGAWWKLSPSLSLSGAIADFNRPRFSKNAEPVPITGNFSIACQLTPAVHVYATQDIAADYADRFRIGQKLAITRQVKLLIGLGTSPTELSGGVIFDFLGFTVEYGYRDNVYLGGTHRVGMSWSY